MSFTNDPPSRKLFANSARQRLFASRKPPFAGGTTIPLIPLFIFGTTLAPPFASAQSLAVVPSGAASMIIAFTAQCRQDDYKTEQAELDRILASYSLGEKKGKK